MVTDHRPLEGIFKKEIFQVENTRLQRMREKLAAYSFTVSWVPGKTHMIADALSRAPYFAGSEESEVYCNVVTCLKVSSDPALDWLSQCNDRDYDNLRQAILTGKKYKHVAEGTFGRLFKDQ